MKCNDVIFGQYHCPYCGQTMVMTQDIVQSHRCPQHPNYYKELEEFKKEIEKILKKNGRVA